MTGTANVLCDDISGDLSFGLQTGVCGARSGHISSIVDHHICERLADFNVCATSYLRCQPRFVGSEILTDTDS